MLIKGVAQDDVLELAQPIRELRDTITYGPRNAYDMQERLREVAMGVGELLGLNETEMDLFLEECHL